MNEQQITELAKPLDRSRVQKREGAGGKMLDYLAAHDAIRRANSIFGFGNWGHEVLDLTFLGEEPCVSKYKKEGFRVGYVCTVRLTVEGCVPVCGVGYGDSQEYSGSNITPHELAAKEAEADALKRALMKYGDQFGLILYAGDEKDRRAIELAAAPLASFAQHEKLDELIVALEGRDPTTDWKAKTEAAAKRDFGHGVKELTGLEFDLLAEKLAEFLAKKQTEAA